MLANQGKLAESSKLLEKSTLTAEGIYDNFYKSRAFSKIAFVLANQGEIDKSIQTAEYIKDEERKSLVFMKIAIVLANQGKIELSIQTAEGITDELSKIEAFNEIAVVLANQGNLAESSKMLEESIQMAEVLRGNREKNSAFMSIAVVLAKLGKLSESINITQKITSGFDRIKQKDSAFMKIALVLANQGKLSESINVTQKITSGFNRMQTWRDIGGVIYKKNQIKDLHQTITQLPFDEAITFFKKGIAQSITAANATEVTILQILPFVKADKESTEHLMQMHALYCAFFEKTSKEKIQKFNRTLNIQWALDVIAKFPKDENVIRLSTNLEGWIEEVGDEDDREQIELWAKQVIKGKITEEEFWERVKGMG